MVDQNIAVLNRLYVNDVQILGHFNLFKGVINVFTCKTLELAFKDNKNNISSICSGVYNVEKRWSKKYGNHYHVLDVEGRILILIHYGNYFRDTQGCILVGDRIADIDRDGYRDVTNSIDTMQRLLEVAPDEFKLVINDTYLL